MRKPLVAILWLLCACALFGALLGPLGCADAKLSDDSKGEQAAAAPDEAYWEEEGGAEAEEYTEADEAPGLEKMRDDDSAFANASTPAAPAADGTEDSAKPKPAEPKRRLIVYEAWLTVAVDSVGNALREAESLTARFGGYVESSTLDTRVLRIPSASYAAALGALKELGEVRALRQQSQDVTEAYTDLVARIDNLKALEARFAALLEAATTVEARLEIERELRRVRQELRVLEARRRVLANKAAFATIELRVEARTEEQVARDRVQPFGFVRGYGISEVL